MEEFINGSGNMERQERPGFTLEYLGEDYAGVYISNVETTYGLIWIRNMMCSYGTIVRIIAFQFPNKFGYMVIYSSSNEALNAMNCLQVKRPAFAIHFMFELVPHWRLINHDDFMNLPHATHVEVRDYY